MTKDEQFAVAKQQILDNIETWADLYEFFDEMMARVTETMHPNLVFDSLFSMYAFLNAMRELPEEGDIKVIVEKMLHILVYESEEKLGARVTIMTGAEAKERAAAQVRQLAAAVVADALAEYDVDQPKTLH